MWVCLRLARPLILMIFHQCVSEARLYGWLRPAVIFKCALIAAVAALYLWFLAQLSTSTNRFLLLILVYAPFTRMHSSLLARTASHLSHLQ